jgi:hypothetical protein
MPSNAAVTRRLSFKEALLSPRPVERKTQGVHEDGCPVAAAPLPLAEQSQHPKLCSLLVMPSSAKQVANLLRQAGRAATVSVKVSAREAASSKMGNAAGADSPWQEVRREVWRKRQAEHRRELHARRPTHERNRQMPEAVEWLHKRFAGRCFRCLASDHPIAECCDPVKCALCLRSGHRARQCRLLDPRSTQVR